jgi:hypothetical protein
MQNLRHRPRDRVRFECWGALLLLALFARGMVPAGFMPVYTTGGLQVVLCDGYSYGAHLGSHDHPTTPGSHGDGGCPYAQNVSGGAPSAALRAPEFLPLLLTPSSQFLDRFSPGTELPRHAAPRGPPIVA